MRNMHTTFSRHFFPGAHLKKKVFSETELPSVYLTLINGTDTSKIDTEFDLF